MTWKVTKILVVACLIGSLTPGLAAATENVWHVVTTGHGAHVSGHGSDHEPVGDEHGCTGTFHLCSCHHSQMSELVPAVGPAGLGRAVERPASLPALHAPDPLLRGPDRPPRI